MALDVYDLWLPVTPSDTVDFAKVTHAIYVGGAGNLAAVMQDGTVGLFTAVAAGTILPIACRRVNATTTTATLIKALYEV